MNEKNLRKVRDHIEELRKKCSDNDIDQKEINLLCHNLSYSLQRADMPNGITNPNHWECFAMIFILLNQPQKAAICLRSAAANSIGHSKSARFEAEAKRLEAQ